MLSGAAFVAALAFAALMGLAIQRGGTCTVAAVDELIAQRRATRLLALVEASLWVAGGLLLARELGGADTLARLPAGRALNAWGIAGAVLLGVGAVVNGACVFGAIAQLGSGEWAYALTPLGFYLGCTVGSQWLAPMAAPVLAGRAPLLAAPAWLTWVLVVAGMVRLAWGLRRGLQTRRASSPAPWSPHAATTLIAMCFVALLLLAGAWAYTDVLAELARHMAGSLGARIALLAALFAGALLGGWWSGKWSATGFRPALTLHGAWRCLVGGLLMGCGSLLIPGGNDGLVLLAMPLLWPYAWAAFAVMCASVASLLMWRRRAAAG